MIEGKKRFIFRRLIAAGVVILAIAAVFTAFLPQKLELSGYLFKNGKPSVEDGRHDMQVRLYDLLDPSRLVYESTAASTVKAGKFTVAVRPPQTVVDSPNVAVICVQEDEHTSRAASICQSGSQDDYNAVVCSPYYVEAHILDWGNRLMGHNKLAATRAQSTCAGDEESTVGTSITTGSFANISTPTATKELAALQRQVDSLMLEADGTSLKLGSSTIDLQEIIKNLPEGLVTSTTTKVTKQTVNSTTVQTGVKSLTADSVIGVGGSSSDPFLYLAPCAANEMYIYDGSDWQCMSTPGSLAIVGGTNIATSGNGTSTVTVSTVNNPTFSGGITTDTINPASTLTIDGSVSANGDATITGDLTFNGALRPGGSGGTTGQFLISQGDGSLPIWQSYDFNAIADARISLQKAQANGLATLDSSGKVPLSQLPALAFGSTFVETTFSDCLTTGAVKGDVCVVSSANENWILAGTDPTDPGDWVQLAQPGTPVQSVNGQIGNVSLTASNGLTLVGSTDFRLGGTLTQATNINKAGNNLTFTGTGNVGIGTASPLKGLHVQQGGTSLLTSAFGDGLLFSTNNGSGARIFLENLGGGTNQKSSAIVNEQGRTYFGVLSDDGGAWISQNALVLQHSNGNIGIGTASPGQRLDVAGNLQFSGALMPAGLAGASGQVLISQGSGLAPVWTSASSAACASGSTVFCQNGNSFGGAATLGTNDNFALNFETNGATRMAITTAGNIGIGTTAPGSDVSMAGGLTINGTSATQLTVQKNGSSGLAVNVGEFATGDVNFYDKVSGSYSRSITLRSGNVGIGVTNPADKLQVSGTATANTLKATTNEILQYLASTSNFNPYLSIGTDGSVKKNPNALRVINKMNTISGPRSLVSVCSFSNSTSDPMPLPAGKNGIYTFDGCWSSTFFTPAVGTAGAMFYVQVSSTFSLTINATRTDLASNISVSNGNTAVFRSNGTTWEYQGTTNTAQLGSDSLTLIGDNVGIGNTAPAVLAHIGSTATADGTTVLRLEDANSLCNFTANSGTGTCTSDRRLKKDIASLDTSALLDKVAGLRPVSYHWKTDNASAPLQYGFIAQEVEEQFPDLVTEFKGHDDKMYKSVNMGGLMPYVVAAIKQQQVQIDQLKDAVWDGGLVAKDTTFKGSVKLAGEVRLNGKHAGFATIKAGQKSVDVIFPSSLSGTPEVTIGKTDFLNGDYRITHETRNGFRIELQNKQSQNVRFNWHAFVSQ